MRTNEVAGPSHCESKPKIADTPHDSVICKIAQIAVAQAMQCVQLVEQCLNEKMQPELICVAVGQRRSDVRCKRRCCEGIQCAKKQRVRDGLFHRRPIREQR